MYKRFIAAFFIIVAQIFTIMLLQESYTIFKLQNIKLQPVPLTNKGILIPLDSRPPCLLFPVQLAQLGSLSLEHPAPQLFGNYQQPGSIASIHSWLYDNTTKQDEISILSTDMLIHGGLVASRAAYQTSPFQADTLQLFATLHAKYPKEFLSAFAVIPRLTIADDEQTSPWQWHMQEYTILQDIVNTFDNPAAFKRWQAFDKVIPAFLKERSQKLYANNNNFNQLLIQEFKEGILSSVTIGQDDAAIFGLPNHNLHSAERYLPTSIPQAQVTRGADEIAQLLVAQYLNIKNNKQPRIFVKYSQPQTAYKIMPYMSCSVQETVEEKTAIVQGVLSEQLADADFVLYVHCGETQDSVADLLRSAAEIKDLLNQGYRLALVDLSRNFRSQDTILPYLLFLDAPLPKLIAYAGWNTTSNSVGTAIAQASIFTLQEKQLPANLHPRLYYQNLQFTLNRLVDDWGYQKNVQHEINYNLLSRDRNPYRLASQTKMTEDTIIQQLCKISRQLLYLNISRHAFLQTDGYKYFITQIKPQATLPWQRTFEIKLQLTDTVGVQKVD